MDSNITPPWIKVRIRFTLALAALILLVVALAGLGLIGLSAGRTVSIRLVVLVAVTAGVAGGAAGWALAGVALRQLDELRSDARRTGHRIAAAAAEQLRVPMATVGAELETLLSDPGMPATQRHLRLAAMETEHRRMAWLIEALRDLR